ncbi:MAG: TRAP transporter substrate-binding protein [Candidatus Marinimicrobia bacterium]|nr:TRAP transporter substrate-binding protein [Candidatus Neomarinimicrobiota bacterium]
MTNRHSRRYKTISIIFLAFFIQGCSQKHSEKVLRLSHGLDVTHPVHKAMIYMEERLKEYSDGTLKIQIYPGNQLGNERESLELLQIGSLAMTKVSANTLEGFVPEFRLFNLPYIFTSDNHRYRVLESALAHDLLLKGIPHRFMGLCYYDAGSRSFYTKNKPVYTPDDLKGLKIRVMESSTAIEMVNAMGGSATPISWGELYTALQQGIVDGAENNPPSFYTSHHYEVCKYYSLDEHTSVPDVLVISTHVWETLSDDEKQWLHKAADESAAYQKILWQEATDEAFRILEENGVTIIKPDKSFFQKQVSPLYEKYKKDPLLGDMIQQIRTMALQ